MARIIVIATGLTERSTAGLALDLLRTAGCRVILHTAEYAFAAFLAREGIPYDSLDSLYRSCEDFDEHAEAAAASVRGAAKESDVLYCVMDLRDESARILIREGAELIPGAIPESPLLPLADGPVLSAAAIDHPILYPDPAQWTLVREIDRRELAAEVKLRLAGVYPDDSRIWFLAGDGVVHTMSLFELDRMDAYDYSCAVLIGPVSRKEQANQLPLRELISAARAGTYYREADPNRISVMLAEVSGAIAWSIDHGTATEGEFTAETGSFLSET